MLVALLIVSAWPLIFGQVHRGRQASDQLRYHEIVVREFERDWPDLDFSDYLSATTPGYHVAVAAGSKLVGDQRWKLQLLGSLFTIALVGLFGWTLAKRATPIVALSLALPLAASLYIWPSAVWLLPDGAGWLGVLAILIIALDARPRPATMLAGGVVLLALVSVRQAHIWSAAALWVAACLGPSETDRPDQSPAPPGSFTSECLAVMALAMSRWRNVGLMVLATLPAFALLGWFVDLWGGLMPPHFSAAGEGQVVHTGLNPATPAYVLAVFGALAPFFIAFYLASLVQLLKNHRWTAVAVGSAGAIVSIIPATTYDMSAGRWTGPIWQLVRRVPALAGHSSPVIIALAVIGAIAVLSILCAQQRRARWILLVSLVAFASAQTANHQLWQRYIEPFALIWLALACVRIVPQDKQNIARAVLPAFLALGLALLTAISLRSGRPFPMAEYERTIPTLIESGDAAALDAALDRIRELLNAPRVIRDEP